MKTPQPHNSEHVKVGEKDQCTREETIVRVRRDKVTLGLFRRELFSKSTVVKRITSADPNRS